MRQERWETPVSDADSLALVSLADAKELRIVLQDLHDPAGRRFQFVFRRIVAYRNILEEYRVSEPQQQPGLGWTSIILDSPWLAELRAKEPLLDVHSPGCQHFMIATEDDVLDVLTPEQPDVSEIASADESEPLPGKSTILYYERDRERVDSTIEDLRQRKADT